MVFPLFSMLTTFSSASLSPPPAGILWEVQDILNAWGITFGTLVVNALRDTTTSLGSTVVSDLTNILEALRPHLDEDEKARTLLGQFFASVASPELLRFEKGDGETSWKFPATKLSTEQLMKFNLEDMEKKFTLDAPGLSSFLHFQGIFWTKMCKLYSNVYIWALTSCLTLHHCLPLITTLSHSSMS